MATRDTFRADTLRAEGVNALNRVLIFGFGKNEKFEDAALHFRNAAIGYKAANDWQSAGDCFIRASQAYEELNQADNSIAMLVEAAHCYKYVNPMDCVGAYRAAIDKSNALGNYNASSWYCKAMAEVFEQDNDDEMALAAFAEAMDLYQRDGKKNNDCAIKVARYSAEMGDLAKAAGIFESAARESVSIRSFSANTYLFYSLLCYLAMGDHLHVRHKLAQCKNIDFTFESSRECKFVETILQACEDSDMAAFTAACTDYQRGTPVDGWKTNLLLRIKRCILESAAAVGDTTGTYDIIEDDLLHDVGLALDDDGMFVNDSGRVGLELI